MNLQAFNLDLPALTALEGESPRVVRAIATELVDPSNAARKVYYLACFIRHQDRNRRLATTKSERAVAFAAAEMDDHLMAHGITWDGSYRYGTPEDIAPTTEQAEQAAETRRLILES